MEAIGKVVGRIMKRALAGSGREIVDAVLADGIDNPSEQKRGATADAAAPCRQEGGTPAILIVSAMENAPGHERD